MSKYEQILFQMNKICNQLDKCNMPLFLAFNQTMKSHTHFLTQKTNDVII